MSNTAITSTAQTQALIRDLAATADSNKDGQVSTTEFGDFIVNLVQGVSQPHALGSATSLGAFQPFQSAQPALSSPPMFRGFDSTRSVSAAGTLKYDAYNMLQNYDPRDPTSMRGAFTMLASMHPGQYELDTQDNLMLTGTADGYIGARPVDRNTDWNNRNQDWSWDWFAYNEAHPGPNGEVT